MHVLIYDPIHTGHHLNWVRLLSDACAPYASRITFATNAKASSSPEFAEHLGPIAGNIHVDPCSEPVTYTRLGGFRVARQAWSDLAAAIRRNRPDHVFITFADTLVRAPLVMSKKEMDLGLPPSSIESIIFAAPYEYLRNLPLKMRLRVWMEYYGTTKLPFGRLMFLAPQAVDWFKRRGSALAGRSIELPDPVTPIACHEKAAARRALGLPEEGRLVGCIGVLDIRKGVDQFVKAFSETPLRDNDRLLLAGRATAEVVAAVEAARKRIDPSRILMINRTLSNDELDLAVSAVDLVSVTYLFPLHIGSASLLIRATAAGRPVLSMERGWPGYITRKLSLGWIYPENQDGHQRAIQESLEGAQQFKLSEDAEAFARYHSRDTLQEMLVRQLRSRVQTPVAV